MGALDHSIVCLRIFGDDLVPEEITSLLGAAPTEAHLKGEEIVGANTGKVRITKTGRWSISATDCSPEDVEGQLFEILNQLTQDTTRWTSVTSRFETDLFCGIFMGNSNDGLELSAKALLALGERGISLGLDIYDPTDEDEGDEP
jgi:hypothetical protein